MCERHLFDWFPSLSIWRVMTWGFTGTAANTTSLASFVPVLRRTCALGGKTASHSEVFDQVSYRWDELDVTYQVNFKYKTVLFLKNSVGILCRSFFINFFIYLFIYFFLLFCFCPYVFLLEIFLFVFCFKLRTRTSMPEAGFEPAILWTKRVESGHASTPWATRTGPPRIK